MNVRVSVLSYSTLPATEQAVDIAGLRGTYDFLGIAHTYRHTYIHGHGVACRGAAWQLRTSPCVLHVSAASFNFHRANRGTWTGHVGVCNTVSV